MISPLLRVLRLWSLQAQMSLKVVEYSAGNGRVHLESHTPLLLGTDCIDGSIACTPNLMPGLVQRAWHVVLLPESGVPAKGDMCGVQYAY